MPFKSYGIKKSERWKMKNWKGYNKFTLYKSINSKTVFFTQVKLLEIHNEQHFIVQAFTRPVLYS